MLDFINAPEGRVVHKGPRLELRLVDQPVQDGVIEKEVVIHRGAVIILPFLNDDRIVLIRNTRIAIGAELWELPAGTLDGGESPKTCAARELTEETGYTASSIEPLGFFLNAPGWSTYRLFAFVARGLTPGKQKLEKDEKIHVHVKSTSDVLAMIERGEIIDGKTITSLALYATNHGTFSWTTA